jgi:hypothetical protein
MEKPKLKYENGNIVAEASVQLDTDKDGKPAIKLSAVLEIDAMEAVNEIVKEKVPQWLKDLVAKKESQG